MEGKGNHLYEPQYESQEEYSHVYGGQTSHPIVEESAVAVPQAEVYSFEDPPVTIHSAHRKRNLFLWALRYGGTIVAVGAALAAPVISFRDDVDQTEAADQTIQERQYNNLVYYIFLWLLITWICGCVCDIIALNLPYLFRFIARYVNPAHTRYWRLFRPMRLPITMVGTVFASFLSFDRLIPNNELLTINFGKQDLGWDDIIDILFFLCALWVGFYFVEKLAILYITIHHHYRSNLKQIAQSKEMHGALITLYDASVQLNPVGIKSFENEDSIIRNAKGLQGGSARKRVTTYLSKIGVDSYGMTSFFGNFFSTDPKSHWMKPASSFAVVERSLASPKATAALARRIWMSLVAAGKTSLTARDVAEVLGPYRSEEAKQLFKILDQNDSGDIQLDEMVWTVVEAGQIRHNIYQSMHDADHCINTFDWVCLTILATVMVFFILITYVPTIKEIQQTLSFVALGLSFAVGRSFNHFLVGVVYVLFDHPFDTGDRVEIYNIASNNSVSAVVIRQSLLYTCFRRLDNGLELQISNERLSQKRIENATRSGLNRQAVTIFIDFRTSFKDIMCLKTRLISFLTAPENRRDYQPDLGLSIVNIHELNKMELRLNFVHKANWSNEKLRATRSNKFMCALVAAIRKVPIYKPGAINGISGDAEKPLYTVMINKEEADEKIKAGKAARDAKRHDAPPRIPAASASSSFTGKEREKPYDEAEVSRAAKEAAEAAAEEGAFEKMTMVPSFPVEYGIKGTGSSSAVEVEQLIGRGCTGMRMFSNLGHPGYGV